jgi:hypothetical protein
MVPRSPTRGYVSAFITKIHPNASIDLDEKHFAMIGKVAAAWSLLEYALDRAINHLSASDDERGYCVTSQILSASNKMKALISLIELRPIDKNTLAQLHKIQQEIYRLIDQRNRYIHDVWIKDKETGQHFRHQLVTKEGQLLLDNIPVDYTAAEKLVKAITKLRLDFIYLWMRLPSDGSYPTTSILLQPDLRI